MTVEPTASQTVAVAAPIVSAVGMTLDFTLWPFALAFFFAAITLGAYEEDMPARKAFWNVLASTALGGGLSQVSAVPILLCIKAYLPAMQPWADVAQLPMTFVIATVIGLTAHKAMPRFLKLIGEFRSTKS
jgi:hypothetical protein